MKPGRDEILQRFDTLIEKGETTLASCTTSLTGDPIPRSDDYFAFRTQALNLVRRACGEASSHYAELRRLATESESANHSAFYPHCVGVVRAARADVDLGLVTEPKGEVAAELIVGIVDTAARHLASGSLAAAIAVGGAALDAALATVADLRGTTTAGADDAATRNDRLAEAGVYSPAIQRRIADLLALRDAATAKEPIAPGAPDVEDLLGWVRRFAADYLG